MSFDIFPEEDTSDPEDILDDYLNGNVLSQFYMYILILHDPIDQDFQKSKLCLLLDL